MPVSVEIGDGWVRHRISGRLTPDEIDAALEHPGLHHAIESVFDRLIVVDPDARLDLLTFEALSLLHRRIAAIERDGGRLPYTIAIVVTTAQHRILAKLHIALMRYRREGPVRELIADSEAAARIWLGIP